MSVQKEITPLTISYAAMREKSKKAIDTISYNDIFLDAASSMFEYVHAGTDKPFEDIRTNFIELYLIVEGSAAVVDSEQFRPMGIRPEKGVLVCHAERAGSPNANGLGRDLIVSTDDGRVVTIRDFETEGKDKVVYFKNNRHAFPDFTIGESGDIMAEIQKSKRHNIINSRLTPIVVVRDVKAKTAMERALQENNAGSYAVVLSDNIIEEGQELVLKVTDVKDQDKIQYLNHAYDDEMRHWYNLHGLDITGASKQAQQTEAEVSSGQNSRKISPYSMLAERKKAVERLNEVFGYDCEVRFSYPWRLEFGLEKTPVEEKKEELAENVSRETSGEETETPEGKEGGEDESV